MSDDPTMFVLNKNYLFPREMEYVYCSCRNFSIAEEGDIPCVYTTIARMTKEQATEKGWRITENKKLCAPGEKYTWLCPKCAEKYKDIL